MKNSKIMIEMSKPKKVVKKKMAPKKKVTKKPVKKKDKKSEEIRKLKAQVFGLQDNYEEVARERTMWKERFNATQEGINDQLRDEIDDLNQALQNKEDEMTELSDDFEEYKRDRRNDWGDN